MCSRWNFAKKINTYSSVLHSHNVFMKNIMAVWNKQTAEPDPTA